MKTNSNTVTVNGVTYDAFLTLEKDGRNCRHTQRISLGKYDPQFNEDVLFWVSQGYDVVVYDANLHYVGKY